MELRQFTYVDMVAACGSFTKAAAKLFISQPALSNYIGKVEEEVYHLSKTPITWELSALYREGAYIGQVERDLLEIAKCVMLEHKKGLY